MAPTQERRNDFEQAIAPLPASEEPARTRGQFGKRTWRLPGYGLILSLPILVWQLLFL